MYIYHSIIYSYSYIYINVCVCVCIYIYINYIQVYNDYIHIIMYIMYNDCF
jgi:hypothetical protein